MPASLAFALTLPSLCCRRSVASPHASLCLLHSPPHLPPKSQTQPMPQPMHSSSLMRAILSLGATSMHSFPIRTTGHDFLHSWRQRFGLHLSLLTIAIRVSFSCVAISDDRRVSGWRGRVKGGTTTAAGIATRDSQAQEPQPRLPVSCWGPTPLLHSTLRDYISARVAAD